MKNVSLAKRGLEILSVSLLVLSTTCMVYVLFSPQPASSDMPTPPISPYKIGSPSKHSPLPLLRSHREEAFIPNPPALNKPIFPASFKSPRFLTMDKIYSSTEFLLSNGVRLRSTVLGSQNPNMQKTLLLEWICPSSNSVQWGLYDPSRVKVWSDQEIDQYSLYQKICTPWTKDKIYSSLEDGSLFIDTESVQDRLVDFALQIQQKTGPFARVEFVPKAPASVTH